MTKDDTRLIIVPEYGKFVIPVPETWIEMKSITRARYNYEDKMVWGFSPFMERETPKRVVEKLDFISPTEVSTQSGAVAEWIVERMGYMQTLRFRNEIGWSLSNWDEEFYEIEPDMAFISHGGHWVAKTKCEESALLIAIKFGHFLTGTDSRLSVFPMFELADGETVSQTSVDTVF